MIENKSLRSANIEDSIAVDSETVLALILLLNHLRELPLCN
jgi:hypothetical protein